MPPWWIGVLGIAVFAAAPATALEPGDLVVSLPDAVLVVDAATGEMFDLEPDVDPSGLAWGHAVAGPGGVMYLLETSAETGRVVEIVPDDRSSRVVVEDASLSSSDGIAVAVDGGGGILRFRWSCGIGFELALVLPMLMALRRLRRGRSGRYP